MPIAAMTLAMTRQRRCFNRNAVMAQVNTRDERRRDCAGIAASTLSAGYRDRGAARGGPHGGRMFTARADADLSRC